MTIEQSKINADLDLKTGSLVQENLSGVTLRSARFTRDGFLTAMIRLYTTTSRTIIATLLPVVVF